ADVLVNGVISEPGQLGAPALDRDFDRRRPGSAPGFGEQPPRDFEVEPPTHADLPEKAVPIFTLRKRAGDAPWPVPMVCCGWPLPQLGVPQSVQYSREQMASIAFQNSVVIPE